MNCGRASLFSIALHSLLIAAGLWLARDVRREDSAPIEVEVRAPVSGPVAAKTPARAARLRGVDRRSPPRLADLDLRPTFARPGWLANAPAAEPSGTASQAMDLARTRFQVTTAFDKLAHQINRNFDFPDLLVEFGVTGTAALDLRFDDQGRIDEARSTLTGSHRAIRGLLAQAARLGLLEWYRSDAYRLHREEFRHQHFRAEFEITYTDKSEARLDRTGVDSYQMYRRRQKSVCAHPGGVELICLAQKTQGAIENLLTDKAGILYRQLRDRLDRFDEIGLSGINEDIAGG